MDLQKMTKTATAFCLAMLLGTAFSWACTNLIVTKAASADGSNMLTYSADSHQLYGELYYTPAADHPVGSMRTIKEWDTGKYLGEIPQVAHTYSVIGNMNEHQVLIGETTFGGRHGFYDSTAIMDYGSLIYVALERSKTAREAIAVIDDLMQKYGYASEGESFSIADPNEVWVMEIMGKAPKYNKKGVNVNKGAVWVAKRIPDGYISGHANQARITKIDFEHKNYCLYSKDVISHAREQGIFSGKDEDFSFCDTYAPLDFSAMRACESRVWAFFNRFAYDMEQYLDYAMGYNKQNRFPLYVKPKQKISVKELADMMRDHFEGTPMDMTTDIGAGGSAHPYRWRPMDFEYEGAKYVNERAIATQQTGWWFVGQCRPNLPDEIGGLFWFGTDDAATSPLMPFYCGSLQVPECVAVGNGSLLEYSPTSMYWMVSRIAQFAYLRYDKIGAEVRSIIDNYENSLMNSQTLASVDAKAEALYQTDPKAARAFLTEFSTKNADQLFKRWENLDKYLLVKYIDGNQKLQNPDGSFKNNGYSESIPEYPLQEGYTQKWKEAVVKDNGKVLKVPDASF